MFWRLTGFSASSPVERILDKGKITLEELLEEDEIIQECKALNGRLINFLQEQAQIEQLIIYLVEEPPDDSDKSRTFKYPFIACEIFTCEVDIILKTLVEDEKLMNLLFSFLNENHSHNTQLAGYFSKVVICLMSQETNTFLQYVQAHQYILQRLVDLIGITSIMEVLIRLLGADENLYTNYAEEMKWIEGTDVLELIVDKFRSSDSPEVHANAAETLRAVTQFSPPGLADKISSPSFIGRLFSRVLDKSRPKSVLVNSLTVCISLLDPKRQAPGSYLIYSNRFTQGSRPVANPGTVDGMLDSLGDLLKLLDVSSSESVLRTTYGKLQPPLGKHRLKIVEFISVLLALGSKAVEETIIQLGVLKKALDMFLQYPYNNFLHHHVESIILYSLESKNSPLLEHVLHECDLVGKILKAEKNVTLTSDPNWHTVAAEGKLPPRIGNIGHLTRISNKLIQLGKNSSEIQAHLQENSEWDDWHKNVLSQRNKVENVYQWSCGRPTTMLDRYRYFEDDNYQDRDDDGSSPANKDPNVDDDESANPNKESAKDENVSSQQGSDQQSDSLLTNSNWFADKEDRAANELSSVLNGTPSPSSEHLGVSNSSEAVDVKDGSSVDAASSTLTGTRPEMKQNHVSTDSKETSTHKSEKQPEQVQSSKSLNPVDSPEVGDKPTVTSRESNKELEKEVESSKSSNPVNAPDEGKPVKKSSQEHQVELHSQGGGKQDSVESRPSSTPSSALAKGHNSTDGGTKLMDDKQHSTSSDSASISAKITAGKEDAPNPKCSKDDRDDSTSKISNHEEKGVSPTSSKHDQKEVTSQSPKHDQKDAKLSGN